jgi:hypothetical protein
MLSLTTTKLWDSLGHARPLRRGVGIRVEGLPTQLSDEDRDYNWLGRRKIDQMSIPPTRI